MKNTLILFCLFAFHFSSNAQVCNYPAIDSTSNVNFVCKGSLQINGKIDNTSIVRITSVEGNIVIVGKIDAHSNVIITAKRGSVTFKNKIDNGASVRVICRGDIAIQGKIDGAANCDFNTERGKITVTDKVGNSGTIIKYHSVLPPAWGSSIACVPVAY
jgi:predicted amidohydrolase